MCNNLQNHNFIGQHNYICIIIIALLYKNKLYKKLKIDSGY